MTLRPFTLAPYSARKSAIAEQRDRETREAIDAVRIHNGNAWGRPNYVREPAFDRSGRFDD